MIEREEGSPGRWGWAARALGGLIALIGLVLAVGGAWLAILGGSAYYVLAGLALLAAGVLMALGRSLGAWIYAAAFVATVIWAGVVRPVQYSSTNASVVHPTAAGSITVVNPLITPLDRSRSTRRLTAGAESETWRPMSS